VKFKDAGGRFREYGFGVFQLSGECAAKVMGIDFGLLGRW
jgi:hypothetical protein